MRCVVNLLSYLNYDDDEWDEIEYQTDLVYFEHNDRFDSILIFARQRASASEVELQNKLFRDKYEVKTDWNFATIKSE